LEKFSITSFTVIFKVDYQPTGAACLMGSIEVMAYRLARGEIKP
jgi:hypothetical protein